MDGFDNRWWNLSYLRNLQNDIDEYIGNDADRGERFGRNQIV